MCYGAEPRGRLSDLHPRKRTPIHFVPPHAGNHLQKQVSLPSRQTLSRPYKRRGSPLRENTLQWETEMGGHFKTKQPYSTRNICCQSRAALPSSWGVMWDYSSPCLWERWSSQSFHATGPPWKALLQKGSPASGWRHAVTGEVTTAIGENRSPTDGLKEGRGRWDVGSLRLWTSCTEQCGFSYRQKASELAKMWSQQQKPEWEGRGKRKKNSTSHTHSQSSL